jgi:RNA polymerase sigma factor (sigma-70 family)
METDATLLDRWRHERDPDAFAEVVARHAPLVFNACCRVLRNPAYAEEVTQECFIELIEKHVHCPASIGGWLHTIAVRRAIDRLRAEGRRKQREIRYAESAPVSSEPTWNDLTGLVDEAIEELPAELRDAIVLRFLRGKTYQETGDELGIALSTAQARTQKGIDVLRRTLVRKGFVASAGSLAILLESTPSHALPGTLTAQLGKLTLAGLAKSTTTTTFFGAATTLGGIALMNKAVAGGAALVLAIAAAWWIASGASNPAPVPAAASVSVVSAPKVANETVEEDAVPPAPINADAPSINAPQNPADQTLESAGVATISGYVADSDGNRLANWRVHVYAVNMAPDEIKRIQADSKTPKKDVHFLGIRVPFLNREQSDRIEVAEDITANDGSFKFELAQPGEYQIVADSGSKTATYREKTVVLQNGEKLNGLELIWPKGARIWGWVHDPANVAVKGVSIRANWKNENGKIVTAEATTEDDGTFLVEGLPEGDGQTCNLSFRHDEYIQPSMESVPVNTEQNITIVPKPKLEGQVVDAKTRKPIHDFAILSNAVSEQTPLFMAVMLGNAEPTQSDEGKFSVYADGFNHIIVAVAANGYRSAVTQLDGVQAGEHVQDLEIALEPVTPVEGIVVGDSGNPVAGASLMWGYASNGRSTRSKAGADTGPDGKFSLIQLPAVTEILSVTHQEYAPAWITFDPNSILNIPLRVVLTKGGQIEGNVTMNGARISGKDEDSPAVAIDMSVRTVYIKKSDAHGHFVLQQLPAGSLTLRASSTFNNTVQYSRRQIIVEDGQTFAADINLQTGDAAIEGKVSIYGFPPQQGMIYAHLTVSSDEYIIYRALARYDGTYRFEGLPEGNYEIKDSYFAAQTGEVVDPGTATIQVRAGETATHDFTLTK